MSTQRNRVSGGSVPADAGDSAPPSIEEREAGHPYRTPGTQSEEPQRALPRVHRFMVGYDENEVLADGKTVIGLLEYKNASEQTVALEAMRPANGGKTNKPVRLVIEPGEHVQVPNLPMFTKLVTSEAPQLKLLPNQSPRLFDPKTMRVNL